MQKYERTARVAKNVLCKFLAAKLEFTVDLLVQGTVAVTLDGGAEFFVIQMDDIIGSGDKIRLQHSGQKMHGNRNSDKFTENQPNHTADLYILETSAGENTDDVVEVDAPCEPSSQNKLFNYGVSHGTVRNGLISSENLPSSNPGNAGLRYANPINSVPNNGPRCGLGGIGPRVQKKCSLNDQNRRSSIVTQPSSSNGRKDVQLPGGHASDIIRVRNVDYVPPNAQDRNMPTLRNMCDKGEGVMPRSYSGEESRTTRPILNNVPPRNCLYNNANIRYRAPSCSSGSGNHDSSSMARVPNPAPLHQVIQKSSSVQSTNNIETVEDDVTILNDSDEEHLEEDEISDYGNSVVDLCDANDGGNFSYHNAMYSNKASNMGENLKPNASYSNNTSHMEENLNPNVAYAKNPSYMGEKLSNNATCSINVSNMEENLQGNARECSINPSCNNRSLSYPDNQRFDLNSILVDSVSDNSQAESNMIYGAIVESDTTTVKTDSNSGGIFSNSSSVTTVKSTYNCKTVSTVGLNQLLHNSMMPGYQSSSSIQPPDAECGIKISNIRHFAKQVDDSDCKSAAEVSLPNDRHIRKRTRSNSSDMSSVIEKSLKKVKVSRVDACAKQSGGNSSADAAAQSVHTGCQLHTSKTVAVFHKMADASVCTEDLLQDNNPILNFAQDHSECGQHSGYDVYTQTSSSNINIAAVSSQPLSSVAEVTSRGLHTQLISVKLEQPSVYIDNAEDNLSMAQQASRRELLADIALQDERLVEPFSCQYNNCDARFPLQCLLSTHYKVFHTNDQISSDKDELQVTEANISMGSINSVSPSSSLDSVGSSVLNSETDVTGSKTEEGGGKAEVKRENVLETRTQPRRAATLKPCSWPGCTEKFYSREGLMLHKETLHKNTDRSAK